MSDRPIIFSAPMVRALLDGRKTQTRRVLNPQPYPFECDGRSYWNASGCVGGRISTSDADLLRLHRWAVGDRRWVKEAFKIGIDADADDALDPYLSPDRFVLYDPPGMLDQDYIVPAAYEAPRTAERKRYTRAKGTPEAWTELGTISPRFMPRWASRLTLSVTEVRVERLQDISEADAVAEGIRLMRDGGGMLVGREGPGKFVTPWPTAREAFTDIWESIHGANAWDANPWVAAITFEVHRANIDALPTTPVAPNLAQGGETP